MSKRLSLYFTGSRSVEVCEVALSEPKPNEVLVETVISAISAGTELLVYRGQLPPDMVADDALAQIDSETAYPLKYGYAAVGKVVVVGRSIDPSWKDRLVFSLHPHESHYAIWPDLLLPVPPGLSAENAAFLANMETAVNFVMDGRPMIGERVVVFGQGVVGLLTAALLSRFPLADLTTVDSYPLRRERSLSVGAYRSIDPADVEALKGEADLTYELSGNPATLDAAIAATGFSGRIVVGSWYGQKRASPNLGGHFHRNRLRLISSQVSTIAPELLGRWDKPRRFDVAWQMLRQIRPAQFITHRFPLAQAAEAYTLLDERPQEALQVVLDYGTD